MLDSVRAVRQRLYILTLLGLLASAATLALAAHAARQGFASTAGHVLVIDAGSSGTRMYAYSWRPAAARNGGAPRLEAVPSTAAPHKVPRRALPDKRAYQRVETEPGLDAFADDPAALQAKALGGCCSWHGVRRAQRCTLALSSAAALLCCVGHERPVICCALATLWDALSCSYPWLAGPLLEWAEAVVPRSHRPRTPVFLFGTAGLRKLRCGSSDMLLALHSTSLLLHFMQRLRIYVQLAHRFGLSKQPNLPALLACLPPVQRGAAGAAAGRLPGSAGGQPLPLRPLLGPHHQRR